MGSGRRAGARRLRARSPRPKRRAEPGRARVLRSRPGEREALRTALGEHALPRRRPRSGLRWVTPVVTVEVDCHGPPAGPVRDPVLSAVLPIDA